MFKFDKYLKDLGAFIDCSDTKDNLRSLSFSPFIN